MFRNAFDSRVAGARPPRATARALIALTIVVSLSAVAFASGRWQQERAYMADAAHTQQGTPATASAIARAPAAPLAYDAGEDTLATLRADASIGNELAGIALVRALLDRYEASGEQGALFEAAVFLDRHWDEQSLLRSGVIQRVVDRHCPVAPLLRHFWICEPGGE